MKTNYHLTCYIILFLIISIFRANSGIIMQPYLQAVTDSSIVVMLECSSKESAKVEYGRVDNKTTLNKSTKFYIGTDSKKKTYVHRIHLTGLLPNESYRYRAFHGKDSSNWAIFRTAPQKGSSFRLAIMGDNRSNPDIFAVISNEINKKKPVASLYLGDLCFDGKYNTWKSEFFIKENLNLIASVPFFNAVGNHEGWKQNTIAFQQTPDLSYPERNLPYYTFEYGDVFVLVISSIHSSSPGSEQYKFIEEATKNIKNKWKIAIFHHPAYCSGGHGENSDMKEITGKFLEPNNFDMVFTGHSHFYQHNLVNGIRHIVCAGGGAPLYTPKSESYTIKSAKEYSYCILDVSPKILKMYAYNIHDILLDELIIEK